jgi:hypothetical protein
VSNQLDALISDLITVSTSAPGIASRMDQRAEMAARIGIHDLDAGPGLQQVFGASPSGTDQDDLIYALSQKVADSGVDAMLQPLRGGS